jgi:hypothetical protein
MPPSRFTALGTLPKRQPASELIAAQRPERPPVLDPILSCTGLALRRDLDRVAALLRDGLTAYRAARKLGLSQSKAYRLRQRAMGHGLLEPAKPEQEHS